jgi:alanyl-tRNA synthetase
VPVPLRRLYQVYDTGALEGDGVSVEVVNVQTYGGYTLHTGVVTRRPLRVGDPVTCHVDYERR